jgi:hypothetical protein
MTLAEILPAVRQLPKAEQLQLARHLLNELAEPEVAKFFPPGASNSVWSPWDSGKTAADLQRLLETGEADA